MNLSLLYYYLCNNHFLISIIVYHTAMALCELGGKPFSVSNIFRLFEEYKAEIQKVIDVDIFSAFDFDQEHFEKLSHGLARYLDREVNLIKHIDPSLIGGVLIRAGDTVIDGSIMGRLAMLAEAMEL